MTGDGSRVKKTEGGQTILYANKYYKKNERFHRHPDASSLVSAASKEYPFLEAEFMTPGLAPEMNTSSFRVLGLFA